MGLPGAGKSYVLGKNYDMARFTMIDPDAIKEEMPDYDPKQPAVYHDWSKQQAKIRIQSAIDNQQELIIDGTGTNIEKMMKYILRLQAEGYEVHLLYVKVSIETSLYRNAKRVRNVPEYVIHEKAGLIDGAYATLSDYACIAKCIIND